jgi:hypothetical protein
MWWRIWHRKPLAGTGSSDGVNRHDERPAVGPASERRDDDPELVAWQRYLANLEALDPPGGPPPRT